MSGPSWQIPNPPNGYQGVASSDQATQEAQFYGEDIHYDVSQPDGSGQANYVVTASGDWAIVVGREALRQSLLRRLITHPDEWPTKQNYGVGARRYIKARNSVSVRNELESKIRGQFMRDPRVHSVDTVLVSPLDDGSQGVKISILVTPKGRLRTDRSVPINLEIR